MDKSALIKNFGLAFIPLLVFIAADEFFCRYFGDQNGTKYALLMAIGMGVVQCLFILIKEKRLDKMVLLDTALIILLGGVSLLSGNDIFFKLKPALVEFAMVIVLGAITFLRPELLLKMTGRYLQNTPAVELPLKKMQRSLAGMLGVFSLHTVLIVYAAFYLSKAAWGFISGGLFYIMVGIYFLFVFILAKWQQRQRARF